MSDADCLEILATAIARERSRLDGYGPACEPAAFELTRAIDMMFMAEPLGLGPTDTSARQERDICEWGINESYRRALPKALADGAFRLFPSDTHKQELMEGFLFSCGTVRLAERMATWLREGLIEAEYREHGDGELRLIILRTRDRSLNDEAIGRAWLRWESNARMRSARDRERALMVRYRSIEQELATMCHLARGHVPVYDTAYVLLDYFEDCADVYLDRIFGKDLLGPDDIIGGLPFKRYLAAVRVLSGLQHLHLAVLNILRTRHPQADIRNLLAWPSPVEATLEILGSRLGCDREEAERLLAPLTLTPDNVETHAAVGEPIWPALIRASRKTYIQPMFGLDVNPFLFLLANLRESHRPEWDRAANAREGRWQREFAELLGGGRYDQIRAKGLLLQSAGRHLTDVDFTAYDSASGDLMLVQLKWQHPVGADDKGRRSMARNLVETGNQWVAAVTGWLEENGGDEMLRRLGFDAGAPPRPRLFVLARYHAQFSGRQDRDKRAAWTSWPHFRKAWRHAGRKQARELADFIRRDAAEAKSLHGKVELMFPIGDLAVMLNPQRVPDIRKKS